MKWDEWRGRDEQHIAIWVKRLIRIPFWWRNGKWLSLRVDLHKIVARDPDECFHTHPAWAIRIILRGGYTEQVLERGMRAYQYWYPGDIGIIRPDFCHRIEMLNLGPSYSLWIRGPVVANVRLIGDGWTPEERATTHPERN